MSSPSAKFHSICLLGGLIAGAVGGADPPAFTGSLSAGWSARYFTEGRDNLDGASLWATSAEVDWSALSTRVWLGTSENPRYREWRLVKRVGR